MFKQCRKYVFSFLLLFFLLIPLLSLAQNAPSNCGVSGNTIEFCNPLAFVTVEGLTGKLLTSLQGIIVTLAIVFIVIGAVLYVTSAGDEKRITSAKNAILAAMIGLAIGIAAPSLLKELYIVLKGEQAVINCDNLPGATSEDIEECRRTQATYQGAPTLLDILLRTLNFLLSIFGTLAIIMLVIGGLMYLVAGGDEKRIDTGKKIVKFAVIGIVVCFSALIIVKQIAKFFVTS